MGPGTGQGASAARPSRRVVVGEAARRLMLRPESTSLAAAVILFVVFTVLSPDLFPNKLTYISIMSVAAELGIVSIGVTLLMIGGHFDLSAGAVLGLASYVCVVLMRDYELPSILAAVLSVAVGAALGAVNGALVVRFRIHSFVVTLGTMLIWRGVVIALTGDLTYVFVALAGLLVVAAGLIHAGLWQWWFIVLLLFVYQAAYATRTVQRRLLRRAKQAERKAVEDSGPGRGLLWLARIVLAQKVVERVMRPWSPMPSQVS